MKVITRFKDGDIVVCANAQEVRVVDGGAVSVKLGAATYRYDKSGISSIKVDDEYLFTEYGDIPLLQPTFPPYMEQPTFPFVPNHPSHKDYPEKLSNKKRKVLLEK